MLAAVMTLSPLSLNQALIYSDSMELIELRASRMDSLQLTELIESTELTAKKVRRANTAKSWNCQLGLSELKANRANRTKCANSTD